ncbi:MAG: TLC domain-containing protein [Monoraphidium minutum]|nr:MAG: TLC domain-containing protein [Monoraphidium minutum]
MGVEPGVQQAVQAALQSEMIMMDKVEEEAYTTVGGAILLMCGWRALFKLDACNILVTSGCVRGWPLIPMDIFVVRYYNLELGWYLHLMLKHSLGLGLQDTRSMDLHHVSTVGLIVASYFLNFHTFGLLIFTLLNVSSPILHASKLANTLDWRQAKVALFALFALVFALTRVLLFPYVVIRAPVMEAYTQIPRITQLPRFFWTWMMFIVLLMVLAVMQAYWFLAIVKILRHVTAGNEKGLQAEVLKRDFSREVGNVAAKTGAGA